MIYPFWDEPFGYGILMAIIAVLHVFVSHFAIGGGLYLVVTERRATRAGDQATLEFLQRLSRFFVLITLVFGTLSGVGADASHGPRTNFMSAAPVESAGGARLRHQGLK